MKALPALPALTEALKDPNQLVQLQAVISLPEFGPRAKSSIPALIDTLDDTDEVVPSYHFEALACIGPAAHLALCKALIEDPRPTVRARAALALGGMTHEFPLPVAEFQKALKDRAAIVRREAASVLAQPDVKTTSLCLVQGRRRW